MATTTRRPHLLPDLTWTTLRRLRAGILGWVIGGGGFLFVFGFGYRSEIRSFAGGAAGFGATAQATAQSMQALVGPVDRLDTYGGYFTYHNLGYAPLLLGIWAVIQGAQAIRGAEERGMLQLWLSTGRSRGRVLMDRLLGFLLAMVLIVIGIGTLTAAGTAAAGAVAWGRSFAAIAVVALVAMLFYALALGISQLVGRARLASGIAGGVMLALYLIANLSAEMGHFAWTRWLSPFWYAQQSRVLIPGHRIDAPTTLLAVGLLAALVVAGGWLFLQRDVEAGFLRSAAPPAPESFGFELRRPWLGHLWSANLLDQRTSLLFWFLGSAAWLTLYVSVTTTITDTWKSSEIVRRFLVGSGASNFADQFLSLVMVLAAPVVTVFAVTQAARWVRDSEQRRTEMELTCPLSRSTLWLERMGTLTAGLLVVIAGIIAGFLLGAALGGTSLRADGLARSAAMLLLLGLATGGAAALAVAVFRSSTAVAFAGGYLGASFFLTLLAPLFGWPDWVSRLSIFEAFGHPYVSTGPVRDIVFIGMVALVGVLGSLLVAERRSAAP